VVLVQPQHLVEGLDGRDRRLSDADRADLFGFDQRDLCIAIVEQPGEGGGRHPAGGAAADDHDLSDRMVRDGRLAHRARRLVWAARHSAWAGAWGRAAAIAPVMRVMAACASAGGTAWTSGSTRRGRWPWPSSTAAQLSR